LPSASKSISIVSSSSSTSSCESGRPSASTVGTCGVGHRVEPLEHPAKQGAGLLLGQLHQRDDHPVELAGNDATDVDLELRAHGDRRQLERLAVLGGHAGRTHRGDRHARDPGEQRMVRARQRIDGDEDDRSRGGLVLR